MPNTPVKMLLGAVSCAAFLAACGEQNTEETTDAPIGAATEAAGTGPAPQSAPPTTATPIETAASAAESANVAETDEAAATNAAPAAATDYPTEVFWGDTHLHTSDSPDAFAFGARLGPEDALKFARGEKVTSTTGIETQLERPLDFLVIADHAVGLGLSSEIYRGNKILTQNAQIKRWHEMMQAGGEQSQQAARELINGHTAGTNPKIMYDPKVMAPIMRNVWQARGDVVERYNRPGEFTAFIGYEFTPTPGGDNLHRVVVFRDGADKTNQILPFSSAMSEDPEDLWNALAAYEKNLGGKALAIPHNSNLSNGRMFAFSDFEGAPIDRDYAELRARWEPLVEVTQIKGDSESHPFLSPNDEFAAYGDDGWDRGNLNYAAKKTNDMLPGDYVREALKSGLKIEQTTGVNPYKLGMIGSTDSHTGLATADSDNFFGKHSNVEPGPERASKRDPLAGGLYRIGWNYLASGYAAVWAKENTREAIFDAMMRKEVYATTGPRIKLRFFGGWDFTKGDAAPDKIAAAGYERGVPMGGDLTAASDASAPSFLVGALMDPEGANLDRVQIVKGWLNSDGELEERVYDVAWSDEREIGADGKLPPVGDTVDLAEPSFKNTIGAPALQKAWTDPDFDPAHAAFYYVRVIEIPTPRWTAYDAARYGAEIPEGAKLKTQERAYSSPIWYSPAEDAAPMKEADAAATEPSAASPAPAPIMPPALTRAPARPLWGDTHLHTSNSFDVYLFGTPASTPETAYRFAKGEPVISPATGERWQMSRPLDFLVVSDHAELMGNAKRVFENVAGVADTKSGRAMHAEAGPDRDLLKAYSYLVNVGAGVKKDKTHGLTAKDVFADLHGGDKRADVWRDISRTADDHNDPGNFTSFIGWEWSSHPGGANLHRIIFTPADADTTTKFLPFSQFESDRPEDLWAWLKTTKETTGADFVAIPHNPNVSMGRMFMVEDSDGEPIDADYANRRMEWERIVEMTQIKGDSETHPVLSPTDEFADFETWNFVMIPSGPTPDPVAAEYVRPALKRGLEIEKKTGVNPYKFGMIGSTDSHTGLSTAEERSFAGKGQKDSKPGIRAEKTGLGSSRGWDMGAAGLVGVWAPENTRQSIFDAFKRREVYATTGTRIALRFFAGAGLSEADLGAATYPDNLYKKGVSMGGDITGAGAAPQFIVHATKDPDGANLDRVQIIKGWVDEDGASHEKIFEAGWAGDRALDADGKLPAVGDTVDRKTGAYENSIGAAELKLHWRDPEFKPGQSAFYYARVLEIPTPRYSLLDAIALGIDVADTGRPATLQERAYSSPIWYSPAQ
ncbi:MAG: DUF3604 domain-containing protein [Pseudomonadota bacterium]